MEYTEIRKLITYLESLCDASDAVEAGKLVESKPGPTTEEVAAQKTSYRNMALAGSGLKAELLGTISTEPTLRVDDLTKLGMIEKDAQDVIAKRDKIRTDAFALTAASVALVGDVEPIDDGGK